jgi:hypothetical protein
MKHVMTFSAFILFVGILFFISCKKELSCENCKGNQPPIASAGPDQINVLPKDSVTLDGTASTDPDGTIVKYKWAKISGPLSFNILKTDSLKTLVNRLAMGVYNFELTVIDNGGLSAKDTVQIIVNDPAHNQPPVANAGIDQSITLPVDTTSLNGNLSFDPDGTIVSYQWTKISGSSSFTIVNPASAQTRVSGLIQGVYQFELKVTDNGGSVGKDTMQINVNTNSLSNCGNLSEQIIGALSIQRGSVSILSAGNKIVFAGGFIAGTGPPLNGASSRVDIYDMSAQTWATADLSMTRFHMGTIASGNKMFFAGGYNGNPCSRVDIYDVLSNSWSIGELSEARSSVIAVAAGNKVLFAGGITSAGGSNKVDIYDQTNGTWSTATMSQADAGSYYGKYEIDKSGVIVVGNKIYFITANNSVDVYDAQANAWSTLILYNNKVWGATIVSMQNEIYFPGTGHVNTYPDFSNTLEIYNISTGTWSSVNMSQRRSDFAAAAGDGKIFWAGGEDSLSYINGQDYVRYVDNIEIYDVNTGTHSFHKFLQNANWVRTLQTSNKIFFASNSNYTEIYDLNSHTWSTCNNCFYQSLAIGNTVYQLAADDLTVRKLNF